MAQVGIERALSGSACVTGKSCYMMYVEQSRNKKQHSCSHENVPKGKPCTISCGKFPTPSRNAECGSNPTRGPRAHAAANKAATAPATIWGVF